MSTSRLLSARTRTFETIARGATNAVSRRTSLLGLGAAMLAGAAASGTGPAKAKAKAKKKGGSCRGNEARRCAADVAACKETLREACVNEKEDCFETFAPCCETCSANGFFTCYLSRLIKEL
jgi:hypothetical protein